MPITLRQELTSSVKPILTFAEHIEQALRMCSPEGWELKPTDIPRLKENFERISDFCQEALEKIKLHTGDKKIAEHQNIPRRVPPYDPGNLLDMDTTPWPGE